MRWISDHAEVGLWVGTHRHGLYHLRADGSVADRWWRGDDVLIDRALHTNGTQVVLPGRDRIWVGLYAGGLIGIDAAGAVDLRARPEPRIEGSIGGENVAALLESRTGSLLIGHDNGLDLLTPTRRSQFWIGPAGERQNGLPRPGVWRLLWHDGALWAGMDRGGLARIDAEGRVRAVGTGELPPSGTIWHLAAAGPDSLVLATSGGVAQLHAPSGRIRSLAHTPALPSDDVVALAPAPDGDWWLGLWAGGAVRIDGDGVVRQRWDPISALGNRNVFNIHGDPAGRAWIGVDGRVGELRPDGRVQPCPWPDPAIRYTGLWPDHDGGLLATTTHGLWARRGEVWQRLDQLADAARLGVARPIDGGGWWVSHEGALIRLDAAGRELQRLDRRHGIDANELRDVAIGPDGRLWLATEQGIYRLDPQAPVAPELAVPPVLRGLRLFNTPLAPTPDRDLGLRASALLGGPLTLAYDQDLLTLEYARPGLPAPIGLRYRHRLEPFDTRWTETPADEARAVYTRLPPGEYRFQVEAGDATAWHPGQATLALTVLPPWWMTWWARGAALLVLLAGIATVFRLRTLQLRRQAQALERKVAERTAELEAANQALAAAAVTDPLTRLLNRRGFLDRMQDPHWPADAVLMLCDIDHFKRINDTWGHDVGDAVLIEVAARLRAAVQPEDVLARWGGEEFVVFLRGADAAIRAARVRAAVGATPLTIEPGPPRVTLSAGAACVTDGADLELRLKRADERLYRAKQGGRDRLVSGD
ncbi:MAG: diguanylate cyclase [Xanthomonadales bacterium]|nr:diguanylate cyclase [Xanthomonadales bacterium]